MAEICIGDIGGNCEQLRFVNNTKLRTEYEGCISRSTLLPDPLSSVVCPGIMALWHYGIMALWQ